MEGKIALTASRYNAEIVDWIEEKSVNHQIQKPAINRACLSLPKEEFVEMGKWIKEKSVMVGIIAKIA